MVFVKRAGLLQAAMVLNVLSAHNGVGSIVINKS